ncbi:helix-turn-helix domain-containing protein [Histidinibacterium aquaticum]|uniref:Helix-turn-helix domain-containing protein n=1 Tax=Histidinibacterium aquaticum TaxID=2613962 RepID=A0A5J5GL14_9RHOB|nr:helix-turn-helix domain-containing protein [Histidinibacterium aquaticum]KAA9008961.1 helix-turn-helix domain-containing protein [Histidinibacterium aquaticum]
MIGRISKRESDVTVEEPSGFDAFDLRLGDLMRGERATLGKSLLDVQRELKIKAAYIAAIENADPSAFETPGFIAGYVRSYARYLGMDPEWAFDTFCRESGFETAHGMSPAASAAKPKRVERAPVGDDIFAAPSTPFVPSGEAFFSRVEPGAVGSVLVLVALIGGLGYGGLSVLKEVQKVQFAPVEEAPTVVADLDPLAGGGSAGGSGASANASNGGFAAPSAEALDRLYRPQALDVPVMVARDGPISTLSPASVGALSPEVETSAPRSLRAGLGATPNSAYGSEPEPTTVAEAPPLPGTPGEASPSGVQVTEEPTPAVQLVAVRPAWVRVTSPDGTTLYERTMGAGDTFTVPQTEEPATLRIGESGAVYFAVNGDHYGPVGPNGSVSSNVALSAGALTDRYEVADLSADADLAEVVRVAELQQAAPVEEPVASE